MPLNSTDAASPGYQTATRPILSMNLWSCVSHLLELDARMPWLSGLLSLLHWATLVGPGEVGNTDGTLDR